MGMICCQKRSADPQIKCLTPRRKDAKGNRKIITENEIAMI
jgi:hypothetical protein